MGFEFAFLFQLFIGFSATKQVNEERRIWKKTNKNVRKGWVYLIRRGLDSHSCVLGGEKRWWVWSQGFEQRHGFNSSLLLPPCGADTEKIQRTLWINESKTTKTPAFYFYFFIYFIIFLYFPCLWMPVITIFSKWKIRKY